jgi:hypothetical protein
MTAKATAPDTMNAIARSGASRAVAGAVLNGGPTVVAPRARPCNDARDRPTFLDL